MKILSALLLAVMLSGNANAEKTVLVDCIGNDGGSGWNNVSIITSNATAVLSDTLGDDTGISITVSNRMTALTGAVSSSSYTGDALEFKDSGNNGAFGSVNVWNGNPPCLHADLVFSGLDTNVAYTFTYFASRNNDSTGWNREGEYILNGASTVTNYLDAADNFSEVSISDPVYPDASGEIVLTLQPGPDNTADNNYFYLNAFKIEFDESLPVTNVVKEVVYIDPTQSGYLGNGWNGVSFTSTGASLSLTATNEESRGISATVITRLNGVNTSGSTSPTGDAAEFAPAGGNSAYGNDVEWSGIVAPLGKVRFGGLSTNTAYTFTMYASRMSVSDIRDAEYTFAGANTNSAVLDSANNSSEVVVVSDVYPDAYGVIDLTITAGPDNNNSYGFYYLSAMKIEYVFNQRTPIEEIIVDVVGGNIGANWNQIQADSSTSSTGLVTLAGEDTGYTISVTQRAGGINYDATSPRVGDAAEFDPMGTGNIYGLNGTYARSSLQLTGLNPTNIYEFTFFASRMGATDNREALYTVAGVNTNSATLDSAGNTSNICYVAGIQPTQDGVIDIYYEKGSNNNNSSGYYYLAALKISVFGDEEPPVIEPSTNAAKNLLFFGNSFSLNYNVPGLVQDLAVVAGYDEPLVVADLMGGQDLAYHILQVEDYPENNIASSMLPPGETFDHVVIQGYSIEATHLRDPMVFKTNAVTLFQLIKNHSSGNGAGVEGILYETWARSPNHSYYPDTFDDPAAMQLEIRTNYNGAADMIIDAEGAGSVRVAPVGDAYETGWFDLDLYADDEYHQSELGAHLNAMVLFKTIYGHDATNISYSAAVAAGWTTMSASEWTNLTSWADGVATSAEPPAEEGPSESGDANTIYIDAYGANGPSYWNNASFTSTSTSLELVNTLTNLTGITLSVTDAIQAGNTLGSSAPEGDASIFELAGNSSAYGSDSNAGCDVLFSGMKKGWKYQFTLYNSRMNVSDNRETLFELTGATQVSGTLDAANNNSEVLNLTVEPAADGTVLLHIEKGSNNINPDGYYYVSALKIFGFRLGTVFIME